MERVVVGGDSQNRSTCNSLLQSIEGELCILVPCPGSLACEHRQGLGNASIVTDKAPVEIGESQEGLNISLACRFRLLCYAFDLHRIHLYTALRDDHTKVPNLSSLKLVFLRLEIELVLAQNFQHLSYNPTMFFQGLGEDENVVQIDHHLALTNEISEQIIQHSLKCGWRIGKPKEHNQGLKQSSVGPKCGFPLISFLDPDVVVTPTDVKLGEVLRSSEFIHKFLDQRKRVVILDCHTIQLAIVLNRSQCTILLFDEEEQ